MKWYWQPAGWYADFMVNRRVVVAGLGLALFTLVAVVWQWPDGRLRVYACDVGQGDAWVVSRGFDQVLIDGGPPNGKVLACLGRAMPFWDRHLEMVVVSHPQLDHMGGLVEVVRRYEIGTIVVSDVDGAIPEFDQLVDEVKQLDVAVVNATVGKELRLGQMVWRVWWPRFDGRADSSWFDVGEGVNANQTVVKGGVDVNEFSVVAELAFGQFKAVFTGDISQETEGKILGLGMVEPVSLVKIAHHGSEGSNSETFLGALKPQAGLIGVGKGNSYGHPSSEVVERLGSMGMKVWRTDKQGTGVVVSDGVGWRFE